MARFTHSLDHVRVAAPCSAGWERMTGNERVRFCDQCNLNVYNLSALTRPEAERLIMSTEGRLCVRFYRRADGTILTRNCPVGLSALKRRVAHVASSVLTAVLSFCASVGLYSTIAVREEPIPPMMETMPYEETPAESCLPFNGPVAVTGTLAVEAQGEWVGGKPIYPVMGASVRETDAYVRAFSPVAPHATAKH